MPQVCRDQAERSVVDTLQITRPQRNQNPALATSLTPESGLQIRAGR
jgi:hypothetical protein